MKGFIGLPILIVVIVFLIGGGLFYVYKSFNLNPGNTTNNSNSTPIDSGAEIITDIILESAEVAITKDTFEPSTLKIKKGTQVTWTNKDNLPHQVASGPHPTHTILDGFDSLDPLNTSDSYSFIFDVSGEFSYHDHLNPSSLKGLVVVE